MPLWYYEKKDLRSTPSARDGLEPELEARYRREGARFIVDCGTKLGLRYDSCATGVVFFHRFYMFHSFREFHRYVTAACCLFLAGKTEETPKKCKDIIKTTRSMLTDAQFMVFGGDPKEEVMTMERILLQTIKFDLMVEHPYAYLLKFAKMIKSKTDSATSDKNKVQKLVQMAWTFINDSLCTMLCLQWEPEVVAVSLMYLASRLTKTDITEWQGKPASFRGKWWEFLVEDINQELLEDVCHQVLDLYSSTPQKTAREETPPPPPPRTPHPSTATPQSTNKRPRSPIAPAEPHRSHGHSASHSSTGLPQSKVPRDEKHPSPAPSKDHDRHQSKLSRTSGGSKPPSRQASVTGPLPPTAPPAAPHSSTPAPANPYVNSAMYSSSFMTQEGSQSIQSLVGGPSPAKSSTAPYPASQYPPGPPSQPPLPPPAHPPPPATAATAYPPQSSAYQQPYQSAAYQQPVSYSAPTQTTYSQPAATGYTQQYSYQGGSQYPQTSSAYPAQAAASQHTQPHTQPHPGTPQQPSQHPAPHTPQPPTSYPQNYPTPSQYPSQQQYPAQYSGYSAQSYQNYAPTQSYQAPQASQPLPQAPQGPHTPHRPSQNPNNSLGIRLTSRP